MLDSALFAFNGHAAGELIHIGRDRAAVCRIGSVLNDPHGITALGFAQTYAEDRSNLYPGIRAPVPEAFSTGLRPWLSAVLSSCRMVEEGRAIQRDTSFFSVVTTASKDLLPIQRIPHYDSIDPNLLAMVIYLCHERFSGTSFYRHRRTGYERITADKQKNYRTALDHDLRIHGVPPREYTNGDSLLFETVFSNELRFNSAIIYPGSLLHAANVPSHYDPPRNMSEWRLTITSLLQLG